MTTRVDSVDEPVSQQETLGQWPKRVAWCIVCLTFPLIWVGGLVTSTDAGMAVPDWPTTYGYNMFLYPWETWIFGPWDLFIEHGHRLLGSLVGMVTIVLMVMVLKRDQRSWMRKLVVFALVAVTAQGILGGVRVIQNEVLLAMVHGCTGPLFFALTVVIATTYSRFWDAPLQTCKAGDNVLELLAKPLRLVTITTVLAYIQLILGASIRHIPVTASTQTFSMLVVFHLVMALAVTMHVVAVAWSVYKRKELAPTIRRPAFGLVAVVILQVGLGVGTWIVKYGWPLGLSETQLAADYVVETYSMTQAHITTAHVAIGSLLLIFCVVITTRLRRLQYVARKLAAMAIQS